MTRLSSAAQKKVSTLILQVRSLTYGKTNSANMKKNFLLVQLPSGEMKSARRKLGSKNSKQHKSNSRSNQEQFCATVEQIRTLAA